MRKFFFVLPFLFTIAIANAQVKGTVIDSASKQPIDKAVVSMVVKAKATDTIYTFTNEKGEFSFEIVPASNFSIILNNMGYNPIAKFVSVSKVEKSIPLGTIILSSRGKLLDEVVVQTAPITIKEDTIEYNAASFKVKENAMTEDLLKKLPGVTVDKDGNVTAQGKAVTKVKVNGKDFFGGDVKTATRELPANVIDKVQVIDDYGDQATISGIKEGEPSKVINLQLKKEANHGYFGRATVGGGTKERYLGSFNGNYFNNNTQISLFANSNNTNQSLFNFGSGGMTGGMGSMMKMGQSIMSDMGGGSGIMNAMQNGDQGFVTGSTGGNSGVTASTSVGFNYRDQWSKRITVYGSYSYSHKNTDAITQTARQNSTEKFGTNYSDENSFAKTTGDNHRFFFNMEYNIDSFNYLKISPSITYAGSRNNSNSLAYYFDSAYRKTTLVNNIYATGSKAPTISGEILFNHRFRKRGRNFSATASLGTSYSNSDQNSTNFTSYYVVPGSFNNYQHILQDNDNHNYGIAATFSEPLSKVRTLDIRASHNLNYARNNKRTYLVNPVTAAEMLSASLSNDYENDFYSDRLGVSVRTTMKKYNYTLGLSMQPVDLRGNSITKDSAYRPIRRINIFPIARLAYNFSRSKTLNISYRGNATQPSFSQLQDVVDSSNLQYITRGNPFLKTSASHSINASYNNFNFINGKVLFTNLSFSTTQNQIINSVRYYANGRQDIRPENVNGYYNANGFYTFSKPYKNRKHVITFTGTANYNHNINLVDDVRSIGSNWILSQRFNYEFNYKQWLELGTGIGYSLNDVHYKVPSGKKISTLQNTSSNAIIINSNAGIDIPKNWVLRYDLDYTINNGLAASVSKNLVIMNASIEKQLFKKKNGILKVAANDLFNQNSNISRSVNGSSIIDTRTNRLTRYFMATFTYRLQKFAGKQPAVNMRGAARMFGG